jgi:dTDP-4-amino-4,6-dideoxygalactose transaminase
VLRAKLPHLPRWNAARRRLAARYTTLLADCGLTLPTVDPAAEAVWHLYVVRTVAEAGGVRDALLAHLQACGIGAGVHYPVPLHLQPAYAHLGYRAGSLPVTEEAANTCLSLPLYPEMSEAQQDRVVDAVRGFMRRQVQA